MIINYQIKNKVSESGFSSALHKLIQSFVIGRLYDLTLEIKKEEIEKGEGKVTICGPQKYGDGKSIKFEGFSSQLTDKMKDCFTENDDNFLCGKVDLLSKLAGQPETV